MVWVPGLALLRQQQQQQQALLNTAQQQSPEVPEDQQLIKQPLQPAALSAS
jgi:hypothetical protein